jgi:hypothetical protein
MSEKSLRTDGKYIAVHLRFEEVPMLILSYQELGFAICISRSKKYTGLNQYYAMTD